jgi:hypothetical protein
MHPPTSMQRWKSQYWKKKKEKKKPKHDGE